jgi:hypothetical protein
MTYKYIETRPGWLVSARDYIFTSVIIPPAMVGINSITTVCVFNRDHHQAIPNSNIGAVRGEQNSILILEPKGSSKTKATLLIECNPRGWISWLGNSLEDYFWSNYMTNQLISLKDDVEKVVNEDASLSIDEVARRQFAKKQNILKDTGANIMDDHGAGTAEELQATISILEARLVKLSADEKETGMDLKELKNRVKSDLSAAYAKKGRM